MKKIQLTKGYEAIVDDDDFDRLNQFYWHAAMLKSGPKATRGRKLSDGPGPPKIYMHRVIVNAPPDLMVDHINHDTLDNRKDNLRICTNSENLRNRKGPNKDGTSGYLGVSWAEPNKKWRAGIMVDGRYVTLGYFDTAEDAAGARDEAALKHYGEFATLNFE